ncbi:MAG TPA: hypothetical protein ENK33_08165 [Desulfobacterales bacterium]|nr:hypothetical protein [Desulfobacterales bacterium]
MKKIYFSLLAITLMATPAAAAVCSYGSVYGSYLSYGGSDLKDDGWSSTAYLNVGDCNANAVEVGLTTTTIHYNTLPDLDQKDLTIAYTNTNQLLSNQTLRAGFHYIDSDDVLTDKGKIYFLKDTYAVYNDWNTGLEIDYSSYRHSSTKLGVLQLTPHYGMFLSVLNRRIYAETRLHYIHKDAKVGESIDNFYSMEQVLSLKEGDMDYKLNGWAGQQAFAVKNSGFVVYNLADRYLGGLGAEIGYSFANQMRLGLNINRQWLEHNGTNDRATLTMTTLTLGGRF